jgi:hypothetical protein
MQMMKHLKYKRSITVIMLLMIVDYLFFSRINPVTVASIGLIGGFILLLLSIYIMVRLTLAGLSLYIRGVRRTRRRLTLFVTGIIGALLAMQSIGQLSVRDALVIVPIAIIIYVYFTYARNTMRTQP